MPIIPGHTVNSQQAGDLVNVWEVADRLRALVDNGDESVTVDGDLLAELRRALCVEEREP